MDKDSDFDLDKLNKIFEVLKLESNSVLSDASHNLKKEHENNHFEKIDDGDSAEKGILCENKSQNLDLNNNIKNYLKKNIKIEDDNSIFSEKVPTQSSLIENEALIKKEIEDDHFFKLVSLTDSSSSNDESLDDFNKKEIEDGDHFFKLVSLTDSSSSNDESFDDFNKKEIKDEDRFVKLESFTDSSSLDHERFDNQFYKNEIEDEEPFIELVSSTGYSSSDDDDTLIERGGPEKNKTKKHNETVYERRVPSRLYHPSTAVPIQKNNFRYLQQAQTSLSSKFVPSAHQTELGYSPESLYVNSPDSGIGSPSQPIVSPPTRITRSEYIFPTPIASPSSRAVSQSSPIASPSSHIGSPLQPIVSPAAHATSSHYLLPLTPYASPSSHAASLSAPTASPSEDVFPSADIASSLPHIALPSLHVSPSADIASTLPSIALPSSHVVSASEDIASLLPPIALPSSHIVSPSASTLNPILPFSYENNDKESKISELINSFIEAEEYIKEKRQLQKNTIIHDSNRDDIKQLVEKRYDRIYSEKANTSENLKNENTSLEGVLSHLLISDLYQEPYKVSDELWNDKLNDLYDSVCSPSTSGTSISSLENSKHVASKCPVRFYKTVREENRDNQKISHQIKDNAKKALRRSKNFDVEKYINEMKNILTKIKYQEKSKKTVKIIDYDEREEFMNLNQTNLHSAVIESNVEKVFCLVEILKRYEHSFFDINCRDANKKTALDYAIQKNMPFLVNYLKENNAVPTISV